MSFGRFGRFVFVSKNTRGVCCLIRLGVASSSDGLCPENWFVGRSWLGACATCGFVFPLMPVNVGCSHSRRGERWRTVGAGVIRVAMGGDGWWCHGAVALVGWWVLHVQRYNKGRWQSYDSIRFDTIRCDLIRFDTIGIRCDWDSIRVRYDWDSIRVRYDCSPLLWFYGSPKWSTMRVTSRGESTLVVLR